MTRMALHFGKTLVPNFARVLYQRPRQLTLHPYLNFLRAYKYRHPGYGFNRILRDGALAWRRLPSHDKLSFSQKEVMKNYQKRSSIPNDFKIFAQQPIPMDFKRRSMSTSKNIKRSWRKVDHSMPRVTQKIPQHTIPNTGARLMRPFLATHIPGSGNVMRAAPYKVPHQTISNYRIFARQPSPIPLHQTVSTYRIFAYQPNPIPHC